MIEGSVRQVLILHHSGEMCTAPQRGMAKLSLVRRRVEEDIVGVTNAEAVLKGNAVFVNQHGTRGVGTFGCRRIGIRRRLST